MSPRVLFEPIGEEIEVGEEETDPGGRLSPGLQPGLRVPGGPVLGVQELPVRGRGRPAALFDLRPVRHRGGQRLHADLPGAARTRTSSSSCCTSTPRTTGSSTRSGTAAPRCEAVREPDRRTSACSACASASRLSSRSCPGSTSICGSRRRGDQTLVLDGQPPRRRPHRADDQVLSGRPILGAARGARSSPATRSTSPARTARFISVSHGGGS